MKQIITLLLLGCSMLGGFAQEDNSWQTRPENVIYGNLLGDVSLISINYERDFFSHEHYFLAAKLGLGYNEEFCIIFCEDQLRTYTTVPIALTGNIGGGRNYFEFGLGYSWISGIDDMVYPVLGYRLHSKKPGRAVFKVYSNGWPLGGVSDYIVFSPIGLGLGVAF